MKVLKLLSVFGMTCYLSFAYAEDTQINFHIDCTPRSAECVEMDFASGNDSHLLVKKTPELIVGPTDIAEAEMQKGQYGEDQIAIQLSGPAAEKLAQITENNVGRQLVLAADGKALIAPVIQQKVVGGRFLLTTGIGKNAYLEKLPWLKRMTEEAKVKTESWSMFSIVSFIAAGFALIAISVFFAFVYGRDSE